MLNCTDLACVLHHHHFYAHLHHLKHHLTKDDNQNGNNAIGEGGNVADNDIQGLLNDTDAPNDVIYMVCGVVIAMLMVGLIIVLVAVTISKLRKREESSGPVSAEAPQVIPSAQPNDTDSVTQQNQQYHQTAPIAYRQTPSSVWVFPPLPPQPNIYCANSQDALIQFEKAGLKGFRKQFSGRFKRLVSKKPEPSPVIPPELKPQLKTIYVY